MMYSVASEQNIAEGYKKLTKREDEILSLIVAGLTTNEMAKILRIAPKTVENHRLRIKAKMKGARTAHIIRWVCQFANLGFY